MRVSKTVKQMYSVNGLPFCYTREKQTKYGEEYLQFFLLNVGS